MSKSGNKTHDDTVAVNEATRQATRGTTQATATAADIAFHRGNLASAIANNCSASPSVFALKALGTGGV